MNSTIEKVKSWLFTGLLAIVTVIATKTFDKIESMDSKIDTINITVQELNVRQGYLDDFTKQHEQRIRQIEKDHTSVMLSFPRRKDAL